MLTSSKEDRQRTREFFLFLHGAIPAVASSSIQGCLGPVPIEYQKKINVKTVPSPELVEGHWQRP